MKNIKLYFILLVFIPFLVFGQQSSTVNGKVTFDSDDTPVVGATISIRGQSTNKVVTNLNGEYSINNVKNSDVLIFTYIGMETESVRVGNSSTINVKLKDSSFVLDDIVAIGYSTVRKSDLTGSVSSVKNEDFSKTAITSLEQGLQGRIAGVEIVQADATPGGGAYVQIRGVSTMMGSSEPLYIVDGVPYTISSNLSTTSQAGYSSTNPLSTLAPSDIASIEILKDASATAIYGSQGANGVIIITTKRGVEGKTQITFTSNQSMAYLSRKIQVLDARQYAEYKNENYANNSPTSPQTSWEYPLIPATNTKISPTQLQELVGAGIDWQNEIYRPAHTQEYQLSLSGGTKINRYALMLGFLDQQGILKNTEFARATTRLNMDNKVNDWLSMTFSGSFTGSSNRLVKTSSNDGSSKAGGVVRKALTYSPIPPFLKDAGGNIIGISTGPPADIDTEDPSYENNWGSTPLRFLNEATISQSLMNFTGNIEFKFNIYRGLLFKTRLGGVYYEQKNDNYFPRTLSEGKSVNGLTQFGGVTFSNILIENILTYNTKFANIHRLDFLLGETYEQNQNRTLKLEASGFADDLLRQWAIKSALITQPIDAEARLWSLASGFARVNYNYDDRYLFTYTIRTDGSSKFARNNKWAVFQSGAFAWRINQEQFMKSANWISNLKLRLSYGESGNQGLSPYQSLSIMSPTTSSIGNVLSSAYYEQVQENPNLKWETTSQINLGLDFGFWNEKFSGTVNVYSKDTRDLLQSIAMAPSTGYRNRTVNSGRVNNKGLEIDLNIRPIMNRDFTWMVNLNYYKNINKIVDLGSIDEQFSTVLGSAYGLNVQPFIQRVGEPIGAIYGYVIDGVFQNQTELNNNFYTDNDGNLQAIQPGAKVGDIRYKKLSNESPQISAKDQTIIGNTNPDFFFGINNSFSYKRFDLGVFFNGVIGGDIINTNFIMSMKLNGEGNIPAYLYEQAWRGEGTSTTQRQIRSANADPKYFSRQYIEKRTYVRMKNISLAYNFDTRAIPVFSALKLTLNAVNPLTFTKYHGYDPEVSASSNPLTRGVDMGNYPQARTFIVGLTCNFK